MPELPEVETVRRALEPAMTGRTLTSVEFQDPRLVRPLEPAAAARQLTGRRVESVERRGKYLVWRLSDDLSAIFHLRMTGSFWVDPPQVPAHVRARFQLDSGTLVLYRDVRRFGTLTLLSGSEAEAHLDARLGPEPLSEAFTARWLADAMRSRNAPAKAVLLDQKVAAGVGNIYADEALHLSGISPRRQAARISASRIARLRDAVVEVLQEGIRAGGSSLRDYVAPGGEAGTMQDRFRVYGRRGEPCLRCGATLTGDTIGGRATVWCPGCQR